MLSEAEKLNRWFWGKKTTKTLSLFLKCNWVTDLSRVEKASTNFPLVKQRQTVEDQNTGQLQAAESYFESVISIFTDVIQLFIWNVHSRSIREELV